MHMWLCIAGVAVLEGPMYAVGGHDGWSYLSTVERLEGNSHFPGFKMMSSNYFVPPSDIQFD